MGKPTHTINLRVQVRNDEEFSEIWQSFGLIANGLGRRFPDVSISSYLVEEWEEGEVPVSEDGLAKLAVALREKDYTEEEINGVVSAIRDGIIKN